MNERLSQVKGRPDWQTMLAEARSRASWNDWHWQLRQSLDARALIRMGFITDAECRAASPQPPRVTPYYLSLADPNDPADPILRQCLPSANEWRGVGAEDPFDEAAQSPLPGLVQRFPDRVLILAHHACAVACRHCTRRHRLASAGAPAPLSRLVAYVRARPEIREVIVSGGDPLLLSDAALLRLVDAFRALPQLDAVRIGTRAPVALPMRVTTRLARALGRGGRVWVNTHFNHAREIAPESAAACARLVEAGIPVSNQSVLLRGVNDSIDAMTALCAGLQRIRVRPYYVFVCDPVRGTQHLRTTRADARRIATGLAQRLGGLAVPRFVMDVPGAPCKQPV